MSRHDVLIAGGGLVGSALALALSGHGLRIAVIDQTPDLQPELSPDQRHLALAQASVTALRTLGLWPALQPVAGAIRAIHVSSRGDFGATRLRAEAHGLESFGMVVPARHLLAALVAKLRQSADVALYKPARVLESGLDGEARWLRIEQEGGEVKLQGRLLVAADGTDSPLRQSAGIDCEQRDYAQSAINAALRVERDAQGTAYERLTASGPIALLPQPEQRMGLVWTLPSAAAEAMAAAPEPEFLAALQAAFGYRLGRMLGVGPRAVYPLRLLRARRLYDERLVLVGNAAQSVHPIGAQGFNLGLRDACELAERLVAARREQQDLAAPALLAAYAEARARDRELTIAGSDGLLGVFAMQAAPWRALRSLGLVLADRFEPARQAIVERGMGYAARAPRLSRGLPL